MIQRVLQLDEKVVEILEADAKKQSLSFNDYLENLAMQHAKKPESPSKKLTDSMDNLMKKLGKEEIEYYAIQKVTDREEQST